MGVHVMENGELRATVSDAGAELVNVYDKRRREERIWTGEASVWNRHAPILFPFVGRVTGGKYRANGREYAMKTQHGFARDRAFTCVEKGADSITHVLVSDEGTREIYPWDFRLTVRHRLGAGDKRTLLVEWAVENTGKDAMWFSIGGHPGFMPPAGTKKEDCLIAFPGKESLRYRTTNKAGFALPEEHALGLENGFARYRGDIPDTWIFEGGQAETVGIAGPDGKLFVRMDCPCFPMLAVWANPSGPFICLEPWFGRTDDDGFCGPIEQKKGIQGLEPGGKREIRYSMAFL